MILESSTLTFYLQVIEKNNKRLKGSDSALTALRQNFERVRTFYGEKVGTWLAVDFEAWEMDHTILLEFGWSSLAWAGAQEVIKEGHLILKDHSKFFNGKYVENNREVRFRLPSGGISHVTQFLSEFQVRHQRTSQQSNFSE